MTKSMININTVNALIRDEDMASKEYMKLAKAKDTPAGMRSVLAEMSVDEANHKLHLVKYKKQLIAWKGRG